MSLVELIPGVRSLSRSDKLRLIRFLAEELDRENVDSSELSNGRDVAAVEDGHHAEVRVSEAADRDGGSEPIAASPPVVTSPSYPFWSPDRDSEAAAILMRLLEAEKSTR